MRYLQFKNITIDCHNQLLVRDGETVNLAPKVYDLLLFLCQHQNRVISKDELMDNVWTGTLVTENAISRTLVKVRKALGDDPKNPQFIITVPRKGYRMVSEFVVVEQLQTDVQEEVTANTNHEPKIVPLQQEESSQLIDEPLNIKLIGLLLVLLILTVGIYYINVNKASVIATKQLKPLTRDIAIEQHPNLSPDLSLLAYTKTEPSKPSYIIIENQNTQSKVTISHDRGKLSRPKWSPTENKLAFLYQHNSVCMIFWAEIDEIVNKDNWQSISECSADSWPNFVFSPDGQQLYFNDRQSKTNGYQIFRVNLSNKQKDIVNQPITGGQGNYSFDISPDGKRLVMLNSEFAPQTRIYTLDLAEAKLHQAAQLPYLMRSVVWHHDNQTIVHPSPHPAYEIWQSNLAGEKLSVVASNTSRVKQISRLNNGEDFTFVSYLLNRNMYFNEAGVGENNGVELDNSSVMDYLPAIANQSNQYAFVSKRSTTAEVYLAELPIAGKEKQASKRLTFFNNPVKLYQLMFSPEDKQLAIMADNQMFIADIAADTVTKLALDNMAVNAVSWQDEQHLIFSTIKNNDYYVVQYNLVTKELTNLPSGYQGGVYSTAQQSYFFIEDETGQVMRFSDGLQSPQTTELYCQPSIIDRQLNLKLVGDGLACWSSIEESNQGLMYYSFNQKIVTPWQKLTTNFDYQGNNSGVIYTNLTQSVADIMQTTSK